MKKKALLIQYIKEHFHKTIILLAVIVSIANLINCLIHNTHFIWLTENQILYIYSSLSQILGALLGLIIAGYGIIDSKLKSYAEADTTVQEYTSDIRHDYFKSLMLIISSIIINIIMCLIVLSTYSNASSPQIAFLMTETSIVFAIVIIEIVNFVYSLNPNAINTKGSQYKESIEADYDDNESDNFSPFITYYNLLENLLKEFATTIISAPDTTHKIQIFEALDILMQKGVIDRKIYSTINELRLYRNALVHSLDSNKTVNHSIYKTLEEVYFLMKDTYEGYCSESNFNEYEKRLNDYSSKHGYSELDNKILDYLQDNQDASLQTIANYIKRNPRYTYNRLLNLQNLGIVFREGYGRQTRWNKKQLTD